MRRFWTGFFRWPRFGGRTRAWVSDLHRLIAVWSLPFLFLLILTGGWYMLENLGISPSWPPEFQPPKPENAAPPPEGFDGTRIEEATAIARNAVPGLEITIVSLWPHEPIQVVGGLNEILPRDEPNIVFLAQDTLEVLGIIRDQDLPTVNRVLEMANPIHFGTWGGFALVFFFCAASPSRWVLNSSRWSLWVNAMLV